MSKKKTAKAKPITFKFHFTGLDLEHIEFSKDGHELKNHEGELRMQLITTTSFNKNDDEVAITVKYFLLHKDQILTSVTTKNNFLVQDIAKYLDEEDSPNNKEFEGFLEYLAYQSVQHTRGVHTYLADKENGIFKRYSIPVFTMAELRKLNLQTETADAAK
jgi:hypothetical protein